MARHGASPLRQPDCRRYSPPPGVGRTCRCWLLPIWSHAKFGWPQRNRAIPARPATARASSVPGTTRLLAGYRYASENYNSLSEVINLTTIL
ncbi:hypothetical protein KCP73_07140 [Salmonella enterica subsp. enterica]|nr:hypothetical protein KCP73_07140 [Salmonella enterica subsp. enterica]